MGRKEELLEACSEIDDSKRILIASVVDEVLFLEGQLIELRKLPFIRVHPSDPSLQKQTEAARQYVKLAATYMQGIKIISGCLNKNILEDDDSPINTWLKKAGDFLDAQTVP